MEESIKKKTISGLTFKTIERIGLQGTTLIISIILARLLLPENYGNVALILVFVTILDSIVTYGFGAALIQKKDADNLDFSTCFFVSLFVSILLYIIIFCFAPLISNFYGNLDLVVMIRVIGIKIIFSGIYSIQNAYIAKKFLFKKSMIASLIATILSGVVGIFMAYNGYGEWALITQTLLSSFLLVFVTLIFVRFHLSFCFSFSRLKTLFGFGWKLLVLGISNSIYDEIRSLIIGKKYSSSDLAFYDKGRNFPKMISNNVNAVIDGVIFSTMSSVQDERDKVLQVLSKSIKVGLFILTPMLVGLALVSDELIVLLYTSKWSEAALYLKIFCFSFLLMPFITLNINSLKSIGKSGLVLKIDTLQKIVGLSLIIASSFLGVKYIALSIGVTYLFYAMLLSIFSKKYFSYNILKQLCDIALSLLPGLLMGVCVFFAGFIPVSLVLKLIIKVLIGFFSFLLFALLLKNESFLYIIKTINDFRRKEK